MAGIGNVLVKVSADIDGLKNKLDQAERRLSRSSRKFAQIGNELSTSITLPFAALGFASLQAAADFEKFEKGLEAVMGSSRLAGIELKKLKDVAQDPGLSFEQAVKGSVRLQSVGLDADTARESLAQFGNALALVGGSAADLDRVSLALSQIASKGKVSAEEINQLAEVVPQIRTALQDAFGTADTEQLQKMGIDFDEFINGVNASLGTLPRASDTFANSLENMRMAVREAFAQIGKEILTTTNLQEKIQALTGKVVDFIRWIKEIPAPVKKAVMTIIGIAAAAGPVLKIVAAVQALRSAFVGLRIASLAFVSTPVGLIIAGVAAIVAVTVKLIQALQEVQDKMGEIRDFAKGGFGDVISAFNPVAGASLKAQADAGRVDRRKREAGLTPGLTAGITAGLDAGQDIANQNPIVPTFELDTAEMEALVEEVELFGVNIGDALASGADKAKDSWLFDPEKQEGLVTLNSNFQELGETFGEFGEKLATFTEGAEGATEVIDEWGQVGENLKEVWQDLATGFSAAQSSMSNSLKQGIKSWQDFGRAIMIAIAQAVKAYIINSIAAVLADGIKKFGIPGAIIGGIAAAGVSALFDTFINNVQAPKLAKGGLAFGPTMAMVGDNRNAAGDPEVIAPLSKLTDMLGLGGGGAGLTGRVELDASTGSLWFDVIQEHKKRFE
jgi:tape measure domain-containing protein